MQDLMKIESTPARLRLNFEELKKALEQDLQRYDVVVTADTLPGAKKLATELNKTASLIDKRRKEEVAKVSGPIKEFDDAMRELVVMCKDGRQNLLAQVQRFEDETREQCRALLTVKRQAMWDHYKVQEEFQRAEFDDLILVSSITAKGNLTAKARDELESRVVEDKLSQDRTERRLLELRAKSLEAGLAAPLTKDHVVPFLACEDEVYEREVERIIVAELQRQAQAEERLRERMRKEEERKSREQAEQAQPAKQDLGGLPREPERAAAPGKVAITVTAEFHTEVPGDLTDAQIAHALRRQIEKSGITTLANVSVTRHRRAA